MTSAYLEQPLRPLHVALKAYRIETTAQWDALMAKHLTAWTFPTHADCRENTRRTLVALSILSEMPR